MDVNRKKGCDWILVSHDQVDPEEAWKLLEEAIANNSKTDKNVMSHPSFETDSSETELTDDTLESNPLSVTSDNTDMSESFHPPTDRNASDTDNSKGIVTLKFESFILHVQCRDVESAKILHTQRYTHIQDSTYFLKDKFGSRSKRQIQSTKFSIYHC